MRFTVLPLVLLVLVGCRNDPAGPNNGQNSRPIERGVYVLNEGDFNTPNDARLSALDIDRDIVVTDLFESGNAGAHLGTVGDDMKFHNGRAYIVMSRSQNLVVMNLSTLAKEAEVFFPGSAVHDLLIDSVGNRLFLTRLFSSSVFVLNLSTLTVIDSISVGSNPQGMALANGKLFVCNSGYGSDKTVSVVSTGTNDVITTLTVGDGPTQAALASDGKIWVACTGNAFATPPTTGSIFMVDPVTNTKVDSLLFSENLWGTISIGSDGYAYVLGVTSGNFYGGPVHRISTLTKIIITNFISGTYYGLAFDNVVREIYVADVKNFSGNGEAKIYTSAGALRKTFAAQKGPAVFCFKR
ncbi:MAG: YncE family protein [Ignavibacteriae bacterium]|nr:YncE family protein [Ignavibacteriota bacterium]